MVLDAFERKAAVRGGVRRVDEHRRARQARVWPHIATHEVVRSIFGTRKSVSRKRLLGTSVIHYAQARRPGDTGHEGAEGGGKVRRTGTRYTGPPGTWKTSRRRSPSQALTQSPRAQSISCSTAGESAGGKCRKDVRNVRLIPRILTAPVGGRRAGALHVPCYRHVRASRCSRRRRTRARIPGGCPDNP